MRQYSQTDKPLNFKKLVIIVVLISLLVGGATGGVAGFILGSLDKAAPSWLNNILDNPSTPEQEAASLKEKTVIVEAESAAIEAVKKVSPAVVSIVITKDLSKVYNLTGPNISPFDDFFNDSPFRFSIPQQQMPEGEQTVGGGTGFIISEDGLILTNRHVVSDDEASYTVLASDGERYEARVLAKDNVLDLAVVKIDAKNLPTVELGDSDNLQIGQTVIAIGNTLSEYQNTVTKGIISGIGRTVRAGNGMGQSEVIEEAIQTDAAINPGNSGGPLVNLQGEVVGINTAISRAGQLIGFAIPINNAKKQIDSVKQFGKIVRPFLGVRYILINKKIAEANQLEVDYGALIVRGRTASDLAVVPGSPADKAGLAENNIILEINGQRIDEDHSLAKQLTKYNPGDEIELKIWSKGKEKTVKVKLVEYKDE